MRPYGTIVVSFQVELPDSFKGDLNDPDLQSYLETNLEHDVQQVINYGKAVITLGPNGEGRITKAKGGWVRER